MARVIFDQNVPKRLRTFLTDHSIDTAFERGWSALTNSELLNVVDAEGYDVFVTCDHNLQQEQMLSHRGVGVVILGIHLWPRLEREASRLLTAINAVGPGEVRCRCLSDRLIERALAYLLRALDGASRASEYEDPALKLASMRVGPALQRSRTSAVAPS